MWSVLAIGLCNSIMFPTIFALALVGLGRHTGEGSGLLCMAIVGGAIVPVIQGYFADHLGILNSFWVPVLCYLYIVFYGLYGHRPAAGLSERARRHLLSSQRAASLARRSRQKKAPSREAGRSPSRNRQEEAPKLA